MLSRIFLKKGDVVLQTAIIIVFFFSHSYIWDFVGLKYEIQEVLVKYKIQNSFKRSFGLWINKL
jgi:hypothetical protein